MGLRSDIQTIKKMDPAARHWLEIILTYNGMHAVWIYRVSHVLWKMKLKLLARMLSNTARFFTGVDIHPAAQIGKNFVIDHGSGVVIGETVEIGRNVLIYHQVTLGGTGNDSSAKRHPSICDYVMIAAGAKILGNIRVNSRAKVGANAVVLSEVPAGATAVGVPARIISNGEVNEQNCSLLLKENGN